MTKNSEIETLKSCFPEISSAQKLQFIKLPTIYKYWNEKINVISRKDIDNIFIRHILHSLAIVKVKSFQDNVRVLDVGTGGGFPGIPLAIMFPNVQFTLVDSIAKKVKVTQEIADSLELKNVRTKQIKSTQLEGSFDYITGRAVTAFPLFYNSVKHLFKKGKKEKAVLYLKGGNFDEEIKTFNAVKVFEISDFFDDEFFKTKKVIYLPVFII
ncbi:MAG: 16S rRNA (guanine(527)-N(7))-methyltransferase RsmG [Bacteroidales bacterium]|nr:16S rRNA (guanine(527)-N(7))-methyltransferase RsmG [Bacteroidales bacterium]